MFAHFRWLNLRDFGDLLLCPSRRMGRLKQRGLSLRHDQAIWLFRSGHKIRNKESELGISPFNLEKADSLVVLKNQWDQI